MNKKEFCRDLAALINRYGIDANFETADDILADVAIDALNAFYTAKKKQEMRIIRNWIRAIVRRANYAEQ